MTIERIKKEQVPYDLLYLADEDDDQIRVYLDRALFFAARADEAVIGTLGLVEEDKETAEIVSIAVYEEQQNRGTGKSLIERAVRHCREKGFREILIKTGNCGVKQLALYQRCGFRYDSINKDYFLKHYPRPIYENNIPCRDQIVLKYRIYSEKERDQIIRKYWKDFTGLRPEYEGRPYEVWHFCSGESLPNKLLGLVLEGKKRGTSSALELYEEDEVPGEGDLSIITFGNGLPGCIIETKEIRIRKFKDIGEDEARLEGEGDLSLDYWREAHRWFFTLEYQEKGKAFTEDIPVLFERFEILYDRQL